jgi:natural product precursor
MKVEMIQLAKEVNKKRINKKLRINKETIRELKDSELKGVAGGYYGSITGCSNISKCVCTA